MTSLKDRITKAIRDKLWNEFSVSGEAFREEVIAEAAAAVIEEFKAFIGDS